jgi:N4-gp56 family major capsid protein
MAVNYASSYAKQTVQAFTLASLTRGALSGRAVFVADSGKSVKVFTNSTATMNDYKRTGDNRFGTPEDLENTVQEMICTRERSFSTVLDGLNSIDQGATMEEAGAFLRRQIDEVITPEIDAWTLSKLAAGAGNTITKAITAADAYETFLDANAALDEAKTPIADRKAWVTPEAYKFLKLSDGFIKASDLAQNMLIKGQIGEVDGVAIVKAPSSYMPEGVSMILAHKEAAAQPIRLEEFNIYDKVQGYSGPVVEGLVYYDAFVFDARNKSVCVVKGA